MASFELNSLNSHKDTPEIININRNRWKCVDFGLVFTLWRLMLKNASDRACGILTFISSMTLSISDTISDIVIAITLFSSKQHMWGWVVIVIDYIPSWILALHNMFSRKWRHVGGMKEKLTTTGILMFSPFSMTIFHARWLYHFETAPKKIFDALHHNARLSQVLSGSFESPIQIVILLVLWGQNKIDLPWKTDSCVTDSRYRTVCLGAFPGVFSITISCLSLLKGSIDIAEESSWQGKVIVCIYAMFNYTFRLISMALAILYFDEWSLILFVAILMTNVILISRFDKNKRKPFSMVTSTLISSVTPFVASDQAHLYQQTGISFTSSAKENKPRRMLSAKISMAVTLLCLVTDVALAVLLKHNKEFSYNEEIIMEKEWMIRFLSFFQLPFGLLTLVVIYWYSDAIVSDKTQHASNVFGIASSIENIGSKIKKILQSVGLAFIFLGILTFSGKTINIQSGIFEQYIPFY